MAAKIRFAYEQLETAAAGGLGTRGGRGLGGGLPAVPAPSPTGRLTPRTKTGEPDARLQRLADLVGRYCPVDSLIRAAVPDYQVTGERLEEPEDVRCAPGRASPPPPG